jgi:SAM-dependent methyltransferase
MDLKPLLKGARSYTGADLFPGEGIIACDLEKELPFADGEFDIVTALDVLEHLNNPHAAIKELQRVARKAVFISLPNMYYIHFRWNFLVGHGISGKYSFLPNAILDRHRWVMSYKETLDFVYQNSKEYKVEHKMILPSRGRTKAILSPVEALLGNTWPNLFAYGSLFHIRTGN